ncbi:MAG: hypothetical protein ABIV51_05620 [Saprospiraceae bacterium]
MVKKILLVIVLLYMPVIYQGCDCGTDIFESIDCELFVLDNTGKSPVITTESVLSKKALGFELRTVDTFVDHVFVADLGAACYAWSCEPNIEHRNHISKVKVTTLNKYSDLFGANSVITSLFAKDHNTPNASGFLDYGLLSTTDDILLLDTTALPSIQKFQFDILFSDGLNVIKDSPTLTLF